jgi:hypothetical protein
MVEVDRVNVVLTKPRDMDERYFEVSSSVVASGNNQGERRVGVKNWHLARFPSNEYLRIWRAPENREGTLTIDVTPYDWSQFQAHREYIKTVDARGEKKHDYYRAGIALTANALVLTLDDKVILHRKKGGAVEGSLHTFGGYVERKDLGIGSGTVKNALRREIMEKSELGLGNEEFFVNELFGTPEGLPSILWTHGTSAVYGAVSVLIESDELKGRVGAESLDGRAYAIPLDVFLDEGKPERWVAERGLEIHPQTAQILPTIREMWG